MDIKEDMTEKEDKGTQVMEDVPQQEKRVSVEIEAVTILKKAKKISWFFRN